MPCRPTSMQLLVRLFDWRNSSRWQHDSYCYCWCCCFEPSNSIVARCLRTRCMLLPGLCSRFRMIHDTLDTRWESLSWLLSVVPQTISTEATFSRTAFSVKVLGRYLCVCVCFHGDTLFSDCRNRNEKKNEKEKSVSSAVRLHHNNRLPLFPALEAAATHPELPAGSKTESFSRHK